MDQVVLNETSTIIPPLGSLAGESGPQDWHKSLLLCTKWFGNETIILTTVHETGGGGYTYLFGSYLAEAAPGCWLSLSISGGACPSSLSDALADESSSQGSHGGVEIGPGGPIFTKMGFTAPLVCKLHPRAPTFRPLSLLVSFLLQLQFLLLATERLFPRHRADLPAIY